MFDICWCREIAFKWKREIQLLKNKFGEKEIIYEAAKNTQEAVINDLKI